MSQELIDSVKSLGKKIKTIETELGMPLNCLSGMLTGKKPIPLKWQLKLTEYVEKNKSTNDINTNNTIDAEKEVPIIETYKPIFDFGDDIYLNVEKYTKFPKQERPTIPYQAIEWDNMKKIFDDGIRAEWHKFKKKKNYMNEQK